MFKKIVSQLSFSPALVGQLGFYAKRLRKEESTRRLGLIFVALALVVQSLVVFQAPEPANAANSNDMVVGGLGTGSKLSLNNFLRPYDKNERHLKDVFNQFGITRDEIAKAKYGTFKVGSKHSYGFNNRAGSTAIKIKNSKGNTATTLYGRPLTVWGYKTSSSIPAYIGHSKKAGWFAIMTVCGNLVTDKLPEDKPKPAKISTSKSAINVTQGKVNATKVSAKANDKITYTVKVKNSGGTAKKVAMKDDLSKVMKYAKLTDKGGGTYSAGSKTLSWGSVSVKPGETVTRKYSVKMNASLISDTTKCQMKNTFIDSSVTVPVKCSTPPANIIASKSAVNASQKNVDATKVVAKANDKITYTVQVKNTGGTAKKVAMKDDLSDVLGLAKLVNNGGGTFNATTQEISWPEVNVKPGATVSRKYTVQLNGSLVNDTTDCRMVNNFMNKSTTVRADCTIPKPKPDPTPDPADITVSKTSANVSQGNIDATTTTAKENDRITFTLTASNGGGTAKDFTFEDDLSDVLEYAKVINNGGGTFDEKTQKLTWPVVSLKPEQKEVRTFTVQILATIPATPKGVSDASSYDCRIENTFYESSVIIPVSCPTPKVIEEVVPELPQTGPRENMLFAGILFSIVVYFYLRSRQLGTEVRLIRRDINGGTI